MGDGKHTALLYWVGFIVVLYVVIGYSTGAVGAQACPEKTLGTGSTLHISYFGNRFCVYCWSVGPYLERLGEEYADVLTIDYYDSRYCADVMQSYELFATPGFHFKTVDGALSHAGYLNEIDMKQIICETTGQCT